MVAYHKKSEQAVYHLNHCKAFKACMHEILVSDRPPWFKSVSRSKSSFSSPSNESRSQVDDGSASSTKSKQKQSSIGEYVCPKMTESEQLRVHKALALHFYVTGTSFQRIEEPHLLEAFRICRPDVKVPNRKQLAGPLLDMTYVDMKTQIDGTMKDTQAIVCVTSDAWTNICSDPIVNYMAVSGKFTLFIESVATGEQSHSAQWFAEDLSRVLNASPTVTCGACTDNTSTNKSAWKLLAKRFPSKFFHGCVSHGLNLLVKDIFAATKTKYGNSQDRRFPHGYPFEHLLNFAEQCKDVEAINNVEKEYICNLVKGRFDFMYGNVHGVAYALDPRYLCEGIVIKDDGKDFSDELEDFIVSFPANDHDESDEARKLQMSQEYVAFRLFAGAQKREGGRRYSALVDKTISVLDWWQLQGPMRWPLLLDVANKVFNMAASSAASESCFSTFSFVHSQLRNCLQDDKVEKLVYIRSNYNFFCDCNWMSDDDDSQNVSDKAY